MKVFYNCYGSAHSSVLAAAIHTGMLSTDELPSNAEILHLPHYDKTSNEEIGLPFFFGYDELGNEVFIIGMGGQRDVVKKSIQSFLKDSGVPQTSYVIINTLSYVNWWTRIGGFLSRRLGVVKIGRPLTVFGLKKVYFDFVKMVVKAKRDLHQFKE